MGQTVLIIKTIRSLHVLLGEQRMRTYKQRTVFFFLYNLFYNIIFVISLHQSLVNPLHAFQETSTWVESVLKIISTILYIQRCITDGGGILGTWYKSHPTAV